MDEARRHGLEIDDRRLARDLGVPVVPTSARYGEGMDLLVQTMSEVATGQIVCRPYRIKNQPPRIRKAIRKLSTEILKTFPDLPNARWVALRLLDGDERIAEALLKGELGDLTQAPMLESPVDVAIGPESAS
jgi:Fe2+ transport system protein B